MLFFKGDYFFRGLHGYVYKSMKIIDVMLLTDNCIDVGSHNRKYIKTIKSDRREVKRI